MNKRQDDKLKNRAAIIKMAAHYFEKHGYEKTTLRDIAKSVGLSTGAVFSQFKGKDELYQIVYGHAPLNPEQARSIAVALYNMTNHFVEMTDRDDGTKWDPDHDLQVMAARAALADVGVAL